MKKKILIYLMMIIGIMLIIGGTYMDSESKKEYRDYILEQLDLLDNITSRPMMGEYLLYYKGLLFGGIYDNRLLIKKVDSNKKYKLKENIPYEGAKPMYLVDIDNLEILKSIILDTYDDLNNK